MVHAGCGGSDHFSCSSGASCVDYFLKWWVATENIKVKSVKIKFFGRYIAVKICKSYRLLLQQQILMFLNVSNPVRSGKVRHLLPVLSQNPTACSKPANANKDSTSPAQPIFWDCWVLPPLVTMTRIQKLSDAEHCLVFCSVVTDVSPQVSAPVMISFLSQLKHCSPSKIDETRHQYSVFYLRFHI